MNRSKHMASGQSVLHLEDSDEFAALVGGLLGGTGFVPRRARTLAEGERMATTESLACAFVDLGLPDASGLDAVMALRTVSPTLPLVVLSGRDTASAAVKAMLLGAQDWVGKDEVSTERLSRAAQLAIARQDAQARVAWQASHDELTSLPNRPLALEHLARAIGRAGRRTSRLGLLFGDLDGFKAVNERRGHAAGDYALTVVGRRLVASVRPGDTVARWSGDAFVVIADGIRDAEECEALAHRIRDTVARPIGFAGGDEIVTMAVGIALDNGSGSTHHVLESAEQAMLSAKRSGVGVLVV